MIFLVDRRRRRRGRAVVRVRVVRPHHHRLRRPVRPVVRPMVRPLRHAVAAGLREQHGGLRRVR